MPVYACCFDARKFSVGSSHSIAQFSNSIAFLTIRRCRNAAAREGVPSVRIIDPLIFRHGWHWKQWKSTPSSSGMGRASDDRCAAGGHPLIVSSLPLLICVLHTYVLIGGVLFSSSRLILIFTTPNSCPRALIRVRIRGIAISLCWHSHRLLCICSCMKDTHEWRL